MYRITGDEKLLKMSLKEIKDYLAILNSIDSTSTLVGKLNLYMGEIFTYLENKKDALLHLGLAKDIFIKNGFEEDSDLVLTADALIALV